MGEHRLSPLTAADERALGLRVRAGGADGRAARDELVLRTMALARQLTRPYRGRGVPVRDLVQEGQLGLLEAAERFDPDRGRRFSSYAKFWVRKRLCKALAQRGVIQVERRARPRARRDPAAAFDVQLADHVLRLDPCDEVLSAEPAVETLVNIEEERLRLREAFRRLGPLEQYVIGRLYLDERPTSRTAVARELGYTAGRTEDVVALERRALSLLWRMLDEDHPSVRRALP